MDGTGIDPHWVWIVAGLVLAGLELVVPGVYLIWLAAAALVTGGLVAGGAAIGIDTPLALQVIEFVSLALIFVFSARRHYRVNPIVSADPLLNNRAGRMVGQSARVTAAIEDGEGRVAVGDGEWQATGPALPVGTRVRITGTIGTVLEVAPLAPPDAEPALPKS